MFRFKSTTFFSYLIKRCEQMFPIFSIINEDLPKRKPSKVSGRDGLGIESRVRSTLMQQVASWLQQTTRLLSCAIFLWLFQDHRTAAQVLQYSSSKQTAYIARQQPLWPKSYYISCAVRYPNQSNPQLDVCVFFKLCRATFYCVTQYNVQKVYF